MGIVEALGKAWEIKWGQVKDWGGTHVRFSRGLRDDIVGYTEARRRAPEYKGYYESHIRDRETVLIRRKKMKEEERTVPLEPVS